MESFIAILSLVVWPATVLVSIFTFRKSISCFIDVLTEKARHGDAEFSHGNTRLVIKPAAVVSQEESEKFSSAPWSKRFANLFWLANDLRYAAGEIQKGADMEAIRRGLRQSVHHLTQLELQTSTPGQSVIAIRELVAEMPSIPKPEARKLADTILQASRQIGHIASSHQHEFDDGLEKKADGRCHATVGTEKKLKIERG